MRACCHHRAAAAGAAAARPLPLVRVWRVGLVAVARVWHVQAVVQTEGRDQHAVWQDSTCCATQEVLVVRCRVDLQDETNELGKV